MLALGWLALATLVAQDEALFECTRSAVLCDESVHWTQRNIGYRVRSSAQASLDPEQLARTAARSFATWSNVACTDLSFRETARVVREARESCDQGCPEGFVCDPEAKVCVGTEVVTMPPGTWPHDEGVLALTTVSFATSGGQISRALLELNPDVPFGDATQACTGGYDLEGTLTHEVGHLIGLAHPCEFPDTKMPPCGAANCEDVLARLRTGDRCEESACPGGAACVQGQCLRAALPTMWPRAASCDASLRNLEVDDVAALCLVYPRAAPPRYCEPLSTLSVKNRPFGCSTTGASPGALLILALGYWARRRG